MKILWSFIGERIFCHGMNRTNIFEYKSIINQDYTCREFSKYVLFTHTEGVNRSLKSGTAVKPDMIKKHFNAMQCIVVRRLKIFMTTTL